MNKGEICLLFLLFYPCPQPGSVYDTHKVLNPVFATRGALEQFLFDAREIFTNKKPESELLVLNHFGHGFVECVHVVHEDFVFLDHIRELCFVMD